MHPDFLRKGVGRGLLSFVCNRAANERMKAIRLDVYKSNMPAISLYESMGYEYIDTVNMGLGCCGLDLFRIYQKLLYHQGEPPALVVLRHKLNCCIISL